MNASATHHPPHDFVKRRSLQPLRDPVRGTHSDDPVAEGPPLTGLEQHDAGPYWTVLHCTFDCTLKKAQP